MPLGWALAATAVGSYLGAKKQASAAESAAQTQLQGTQEAARVQREMFDILNAQQAPYRQAGYTGLTKIQEMLPFFTKMPTEADIAGMPGYQFGLKQGLGAVAGGQVGAANAMAGGLQGIGNTAALYGLMNRAPATSVASMVPGYVPSGGVMPPVDYGFSGARLSPA